MTGALGLFQVALAKGKPHNNNGAELLGCKIKSNGNHVLEKKGPHTVSIEVKVGKIAGMRVKHDKKGELPVKKYKTNSRSRTNTWARSTSATPTDDYGDEYIYWYPYDLNLDGDTGAIEYVAAY